MVLFYDTDEKFLKSFLIFVMGQNLIQVSVV